MHIEKKTLRNIFLGVIACIVVYWILHETERVRGFFDFVKQIVSPFILGASLAFIFNVPMRAIEKLLIKITNNKIRRVIALLLTMLGLLLILSLVFWLLIPQVIDTVQLLGPRMISFAHELEIWGNDLLNRHPEVMEWFYENTDIASWNIAEYVQKIIAWISDSLTTIIGGTVTAIGDIVRGLMNFVIAIVFAIYCLFQKETLARQGRKLMYAFFPEKISDNTIRILRLTNATFSNFLSGQCVEVCILGTLFAIAMAIFRMPYIPLVSVLVAVTAFIPVVGAWIGCALGAFFIFIANPIQAVWFVIMFVVIQQIENNLIYPRVVGTSIGLSGMWVLVAIAIGGALMGAAGMFLMIPVASVIYTLLQESTNKRLLKREIMPDKLAVQPPETRTRKSFKKKKK